MNSLRRVWDAVDKIGSILERHYHFPVRHLLKKRSGVDQKSLSYPERIKSVQNRFEIKKGGKPLTQAVVILDDVFTTGATVSACAQAITKTYSVPVSALTLALD